MDKTSFKISQIAFVDVFATLTGAPNTFRIFLGGKNLFASRL